MITAYSKDWARSHRCGEISAENAGEDVVINGWISSRRDLGGLIFIDVRDRAGIVQTVFDPQRNVEAAAVAKELRPEYVIGVKGRVELRSEENRNPEMATGDIEVLASEVVLFNESVTPPFEPKDDTTAGEELRLEYRFLDLRRPGLQANLMLRHLVTLAARNFFNEEGFVEVETPILTRSTPEGARDFLVPSRQNRGRFYALPQSPQLFKQLLMISGFDRYVQIARCFRDEDLRANRQPEFTQVDVEMSFVEQDDIFDVIERLMEGLFKLVGYEVKPPFPVISFREAMDRFGSDKPDLRFGMEIIDFSEPAADSDFRVFADTVAKGGVVKGLAVEGGANLSRKQLEEAEKTVKLHGAKGLAWVKFTEEGFSGPASKFLGEELCRKLFETGDCGVGGALLMVADDWHTACSALGALRLHIAGAMNLVLEDKQKLLWIIDFPLFERDSEGNLTSMHHPFTSPHPDDLELLDADPLRVRSRAYDLVLNGEEIGGGSIRIHDQSTQQKVFSVLGISSEEARHRFGFLLKALTFGAPPHGGIALGWDRIVGFLAGEEAIRSVIAYPKTTSGLCLMTKAPAEVDESQLKELGLKLCKE